MSRLLKWRDNSVAGMVPPILATNSRTSAVVRGPSDLTVVGSALMAGDLPPSAFTAVAAEGPACTQNMT